MRPRFAFDRIAIAPSVRTAIVAPVDCLSVVLQLEDEVNPAKLWDAAAGGSYKTFPAGAEVIGFEGRRIDAGDALCWIEATAGTGPIVAEFRA